MKNKILVLILSLLIVSPLFAQLDRSKRPVAGPAPVIKIGEYKSFELPNGLKVFVVENSKLPKVTINLVLDVDPVLEGANAGYVGIAGQLLRKGTVNRSKDKLDEEVDFLGASLNTSQTSVDASGLSKHAEKLMELVSDIVLNSDFKQEELDKIKKQTISGLVSSKDDPNSIAQQVRSIVIYGKEHPYGEPTTEKTVESVTLEKCKEYYKTYWAPNVAYLAIVGDITKAKAEALVKKYLGSWKKKDVPKHEYKTPKTPLINRVSVADRSASVQSVVHVSYPVNLPIGGEDAIAASVLNQILGGSATARLFMNLREKHGFTYGCYSSLDADELIGSFDASCEVRNVATDSAASEILKEMDKLVNEKVGDQELQNVKNYLSGVFALRLENPATVARFALNIAKYNLSKDYYSTYLKKLNAITADDVQKVAQKYLKPNKAHIVVCGNGDQIAESLKKLTPSGKVYFYDAEGNEIDPSAKKIPAGLTAKAVMEKALEAVGGKANILKLKDVKMLMEGEVQGMQIKVTSIQKAPNKSYREVDFGMGKQVSICDGVKAKMSMMGQEQMIEGEQLEAVKEEGNLHAAANFENSGLTYELSGLEKVNGKDAYKITSKKGNDVKSVTLYEVESGLPVKTIVTMNLPQGSQTTSSEMSDYRVVEGVKFAHKVVVSTSGMNIEMNVKSVEVNKGIDDKVFEVK